MWQPADNKALPTPEDMVDAMKAIYRLEKQLAEAEHRVETLKRELDGLKAWLSPARRLTSDALSSIFEWCAELDWRSPVKIAAVCAHWRQTILSTPRAWAFVEFQSKMSDDGVKMYLERSGERPLHIYFPGPRSYILLLPILHRIQCLALDFIPGNAEEVVFPAVQRLSACRFGSWIPATYINIKRFPALRHLMTANSGFSSSTPPQDKNIPFPSLESWSLRIAEDRIWIDRLHCCKYTLVSLELIHYASGIPSDRCVVFLPVLKSLQIFAWDGVENWMVELETPKLQTYEEYVGGEDSPQYPIHTDIKRVVQMRSNKEPPLSLCPRLETLQLDIETFATLTSVLDTLATEKETCPNLQFIEILDEEINPSQEVQTKLDQVNFNSGRNRHVRLLLRKEWSNLPGMISEFVSVDEICPVPGSTLASVNPISVRCS